MSYFSSREGERKRERATARPFKSN